MDLRSKLGLTKPTAGIDLDGKASSYSGEVSGHPGGVNRMVGAKKSNETGVSHPKYLPNKKTKS